MRSDTTCKRRQQLKRFKNNHVFLNLVTYRIECAQTIPADVTEMNNARIPKTFMLLFFDFQIFWSPRENELTEVLQLLMPILFSDLSKL